MLLYLLFACGRLNIGVGSFQTKLGQNTGLQNCHGGRTVLGHDLEHAKNGHSERGLQNWNSNIIITLMNKQKKTLVPISRKLFLTISIFILM